MSSERILIRGGLVITMEPGATDEVADILIEGDQIAAVGKYLPVAEGSARIIDASDHIIIPGFIDTHRHVYQVLMRGLGSDWSLMQYLMAIITKIGPEFTPEDLFIANRLGSLDAIDSGVTALFDWGQEQLTPEHTDAMIAGLEATGIRATFGVGANVKDLFGCTEPPFVSEIAADAAEVRRLRDRYPSDDSVLTLGMAGWGPDLVTMDTVKRDFALARELGLRINMHLGQAAFPACRPAVVALNNEGLLGSDLTFGHCNFFTDEEIRLMVDYGVTANVTPEDECNMGHGWPPIARLVAGGVTPNIGVDTLLAVGGDQFTAMRFALAIPRAQHNDTILQTGNNPWELPLSTRDVLRMATIEGARALGKEDRIGSIAPGKQADLVSINVADVSMTPLINPTAAVVHSAGRSTVSDVFIAGRHVKKDGKLVGVDSGKLHAEASRAAAGLLERCGITPGWVTPAPAELMSS